MLIFFFFSDTPDYLLHIQFSINFFPTASQKQTLFAIFFKSVKMV